MKWSFTLGTFAGSTVRIHVTFILLLAWIGVQTWFTSGLSEAIDGVAFFASIFFCVLLHEFGHALAARRYGIRTPDITLYPIGGIARLERMPKNPWQELVVAAAGPAVNVVIAAVLFTVIGSLPNAEKAMDFSSPVSLPARIAFANVALVLFNLIPAFPMDGGRMLRAILTFFAPRPRATRWAATIGQGLAILGAIAAISAQQPFLLLIALFIFWAAGQEASATEAEAYFEGVKLDQVLVHRFRALDIHDSLREAANALLDGSQQDFPVLDDGGQCVGMLLRPDLFRALAEGGLEMPVREAMRTDFPRFPPDQSLSAALEAMGASGLPAAPVLDGNGAIAGLLTRENVAEFLTMRSALAVGRRG
ncbi:MAG: site-2 protease family protein [Verrucomicrobiae bacterium]|nr:site-2 protease family protein [Verrucomicrobiae bacterium]